MRCAEYIGCPIFFVERLFFTEERCCNAEKIMFLQTTKYLQTTKTKNKKIKNKKIKNIAHNSVRFFLTDASNSKNKKKFLQKNRLFNRKRRKFQQKSMLFTLSFLFEKGGIAEHLLARGHAEFAQNVVVVIF